MRVTHLNGLKALEATLPTGSFRATADEHGVTTAAVGQQIRTLENFLGCKLFFRASSDVQSTDNARRVERKLTASFSTIADVINQLKYHPAIRGQGLVLCGITEAYNEIKKGILVAPFGPERNCPSSY